MAMVATFYVSLFPLGSPPSAKSFFENFLACPVVIGLYVFWKLWSRDWKLFVRADEMDVVSGRREGWDRTAPEPKKNPLWRVVTGLI